MKPSVTALVDGKAELRKPPVTVCLRWRGFIMQVSITLWLPVIPRPAAVSIGRCSARPALGALACYLPGYQPDLISSEVNVCDGKEHRFAMVYEPNRVTTAPRWKGRGDQAIERNRKPACLQVALPWGDWLRVALSVLVRLVAGRVLRGSVDVSKLNDDAYLGSLDVVAQWHLPSWCRTSAARASNTELSTYDPEVIARWRSD